MANFLQKLFRPEYQWRLLDMVKEYDVKEEFHSFNTNHITPCGNRVFGKGEKRTYAISTNDTFIATTRDYDSTYREPISIRLYVRRTRKDGDKRASEHTERDTLFAYEMYEKMRDKYISERQFSW